jgi:cation transport regulator ChaC
MSALVHLFGYGSLMATPENAAGVVSMKVARLAGFRRRFNKRSPSRGCAVADAYLAFESPVPGFVRDGHVASLAVGTEPFNGELLGMLVAYEADSEAEMLAFTDQREGYDAATDKARLGYLRKRVTVHELHSGKSVDAWVYLSNPGGDYHLDDALSLDCRAQILINATPQPGTPSNNLGRALGLHYLEQIRRGLASHAAVDPNMEKMTQAVLKHPGPWQSILTIPKKS